MTRTLAVGCFLLLQACNQAQTAKPAYTQPADLTGEWAVEWEDKKAEYKETIYIWITHQGDALRGSALDPNLIPADVTGEVRSGKVTYHVGPKSARGFRAPLPPVSTFRGTITGPSSMQGRYRVRGQRGPWRATRTATGTNRTVFVTAETRLTLPLTSEEYDLLFYPLSLEEDPNWRRPLTASDLQGKESRRAGDHFLLEETIGELGGWIYRYRILGNYVQIDPAGSTREKRLQEKILRFLNEHGYPWKTIPP